MAAPASSLGSATDAFATLEPGARVGELRVRRVLSRANGGALHQARAPDGSRVLLRVYGPRTQAVEVRERIDEELDRLQRIDHRAVARIVARGADHFALENPGGITLLDLVRRGRPLSPPELVWIGHGLASGLAALHAAGLVHGQVSPPLVHVTEAGAVLVDLGWAVRLNAGAAPLAQAADVRALAAALCFAATGVPSQISPGSGRGVQVPLPGLSVEVATLLRGAIDLSAPPPNLEKVKRVFKRAADGLGLLDGGAPPSLGKRLRAAVRAREDASSEQQGLSEASATALIAASSDIEAPSSASGAASSYTTVVAPGPPPHTTAPTQPDAPISASDLNAMARVPLSTPPVPTAPARLPASDVSRPVVSDVAKLPPSGVGPTPSPPAGMPSSSGSGKATPFASSSETTAALPLVLPDPGPIPLAFPPSLALGDESDPGGAPLRTNAPGVLPMDSLDGEGGLGASGVDLTDDGDDDDIPVPIPSLLSVTAATTSDARPLDGAATDTFPTPVIPERPQSQRSESPFASQGGKPSVPLPVSSDTGSGGAEIPGDLDLRPGLELIHRRVLGQGGMGVVHLVLDPRLGRRAALKVLRAPVTPSRVRRFRREIAVTSRLDHPGIPPVYEAGLTPAAQHYLLMRYVQGESLAELFARRSQLEGSKKKEWHKDTRELLHALVKVGEAVSYAHSRGIVHRDLKPANIMIGSFGEVFVMDWGLARDLHESSDEDQWIRSELGIGVGDAPVGITQDGAILGTPGYLAPEQARGEDVDAKADVFSLGAVLAELLTGKPPVIGPNVLAVLGLTRGGEVEFPHQRFVTVDPELDAIATRALAPVATNRYESAEAFTSDLRNYLEGRNVAAYRYRPIERARRFVRRHPVLATAFGLSAVLYLTVHVLIGRNERALAEATAAQAEQRAGQVAAFVGQGEAALDRHDGAAARERFLQALALDSTDVRAAFGKTMAERLLDEERRAAKKEQEGREAAARRAHAEEAAAGLVKRGDEQLAAGALTDARRAYEQALGFVEKHAAAREGVIRVEERLRQEAELERVKREGERDAGKAQQFLDEGRAALARQDPRAAKEELLKALAFGGGDEAKALLATVEETLVELRMREVQSELEKREASQAERLVARGNEALAQGKPEEASTSFVQALAFDGKSEAARRGLVQASEAVRRREQSTRDEAARRERSRRVADQVAAARAAVVRGREARARAAGPVKVREEYFAALSALDQALALEPRDQAVRGEKATVARELAQHLFEDGHQELGEFVLRLAGAAREGDVPLDPANDPHVVIVEADRVRIGQAFDGAVRFQPTRAFDKLREYVRGFGDRYRVTVQVRSETTSSTPPQVLAVGLWIRVEDRQSNTVHPTIKVAFEGGPYPRGVTVDPTGRLVSAFDRAYDLDEERYVAQCEAAVRAILEPPPPPGN